MEDIVASLMVRIAKYNENLQSLKTFVKEIEAVRIKGKLVRDIDDIERLIAKLSVNTSKRACGDDSPVATKRRRNFP